MAMRSIRSTIGGLAALTVLAAGASAAWAESAAEIAVREAKQYAGAEINVFWEAGRWASTRSVRPTWSGLPSLRPIRATDPGSLGRGIVPSPFSLVWRRRAEPGEVSNGNRNNAVDDWRARRARSPWSGNRRRLGRKRRRNRGTRGQAIRRHRDQRDLGGRAPVAGPAEFFRPEGCRHWVRRTSPARSGKNSRGSRSTSSKPSTTRCSPR
jgi:hypothetical protein